MRAALNDRKIPAGLRRICLKAMAADPADRYASAEELQKALKRFANAPKLRALAAGAASLVLLGGLAYALAPTRTDAKLSQTPSVALHHALPDSLAGELIVRVWSKDEGGKRGLKVDEPGGFHFSQARWSGWKPGSTSGIIPTCSGSMGRGN